MTSKKDIELSVHKFKTCVHSNGSWCFAGEQKHQVGVNSFSIICHCLGCKKYVKKDVKQP